MSTAAATFAVTELPVVADVNEVAANDPMPRGIPIQRPTRMSMWDVFAALQDAADESGATEQEADELVKAAYYELSRSLVSA